MNDSSARMFCMYDGNCFRNIREPHSIHDCDDDDDGNSRISNSKFCFNDDDDDDDEEEEEEYVSRKCFKNLIVNNNLYMIF